MTTQALLALTLTLTLTLTPLSLQAQLPLAESAVDALHAGAALHCWPRLEQSLAEVHLGWG